MWALRVQPGQDDASSTEGFLCQVGIIGLSKPETTCRLAGPWANKRSVDGLLDG